MSRSRSAALLPFVLGLSLTSLAACSSDSTDPGASEPRTLAVVTTPAKGYNNTRFAVAPVVALRNASGDAVSKSGVMVTAEIASGGGRPFGYASAITNGDGRATFTELGVNGIGAFVLRFSAD